MWQALRRNDGDVSPKARREPLVPGAPPVPVKLSVNVSGDVGLRLRQIAFAERVSESSIVEIALAMLFSRTNDANIGKYLREHGASLRRGGR